ncbi:vacuolar ATPase assembly integral membrane protein vma21 [Microbotryomycetes sp. JL201]|nr:vacuolar ATPase assembly integral membrane protein vma21 [Microbotryomycetes sp. JL201]
MAAQTGKNAVSNASSAASTASFNKLLVRMCLFTFAMITLPIGSYFLSRDHYFHDNLTGAGITAAMVANLILVIFIVLAIRDDDSSHTTQIKSVTELKKDR